MSAKRATAYMLLLVCVVIWGAAAPVIKFTLDGISPSSFLTYRFLISSVIALILLWVEKPKLPKRSRDWFQIILHGLLSVPFGLGFLFIGLTAATVLDLSLIALVGPLLVSLMGVYFLRDKITHKEKMGTIIAVLGTGVVVLYPILMNGAGKLHFSGNLFLVLHIVSDSLSIIVLKKLMRKGVSGTLIAHMAFFIGFLTIGAFTLYQTGIETFVKEIINLPFKYQLGVLYMAVFSGNIAYILRNIAQKSVEVSEASLFGYLLPLVSTPLAVFWLGEQITISFILGSIIIATGVFLAEYRSK